MRVLFPRLLGMMLVLPLRPHLTGTTLELASALTSLSWNICKQPVSYWHGPTLSCSDALCVEISAENRIHISDSFCFFQLIKQLLGKVLPSHPVIIPCQCEPWLL